MNTAINSSFKWLPNYYRYIPNRREIIYLSKPREDNIGANGDNNPKSFDGINLSFTDPVDTK